MMFVTSSQGTSEKRYGVVARHLLVLDFCSRRCEWAARLTPLLRENGLAEPLFTGRVLYLNSINGSFQPANGQGQSISQSHRNRPLSWTGR